MKILMLKSILTTLVLLMAILQVLTMSQVKGRIRLVNLPSSQLRRFHKREGDVVLLLILATAVICISQFNITPQDPRVVLHALFGVSGVVTILLKFAVARFFRPYLRYALYISAVLFLAMMGIFLTSALWYFTVIW